MTEFVNLTPHEIVVVRDDKKIVIPPSGKVARVKVLQRVVGEVDGILVVKTVFGEIEGLPESKIGVVYIASTIVAQAAGRADVLAPDTTDAIRDEKGQIVAVKRFQTFS